MWICSIIEKLIKDFSRDLADFMTEKAMLLRKSLGGLPVFVRGSGKATRAVSTPPIVDLGSIADATTCPDVSY